MFSLYTKVKKMSTFIIEMGRDKFIFFFLTQIKIRTFLLVQERYQRTHKLSYKKKVWTKKIEAS